MDISQTAEQLVHVHLRGDREDQHDAQQCLTTPTESGRYSITFYNNGKLVGKVCNKNLIFQLFPALYNNN